MDLAGNWRRLLAQQNVTTGGQGITPQQAAALQYGDIMGNYENAAAREKLGLQQKQMESQNKYQQGILDIDTKKLGLGQQQLDLQSKAMADRMMLAQANLAEQSRQFTGRLGLDTQIFQAQKAAQDARYGLMQDQIAAQNMANTVKGAVTLPIAGMQLYTLGKATGATDFLSGAVKDIGIKG